MACSIVRKMIKIEDLSHYIFNYRNILSAILNSIYETKAGFIDHY